MVCGFTGNGIIISLQSVDKETMLQREYTPDCMDKRNRYMVDHADYILAVWNGCPSGTGNTVRYAHKKGKSIIVINPASLEVTQE